ncbi:hypothetical protein [Rubinisphaera sp.]|uniref:hypothetical protein n=1 Tax=Rubinisphaera sp. TaxID=2024857 RepID=UPI000C10384E|nr:hypothetical protein [Rubinisphaera sp.]MBV07669.1 hypothetical protein [Rubinisphaera sp.]|tara:strand:- start:649 stop:861 length:213 start_codon:yes stop_codon:yes gene_type:complete
MITSILTGLVAGLGIEAVGAFGATKGSMTIVRLLRMAPTIFKLAKAVRESTQHEELHKQADHVMKELQKP